LGHADQAVMAAAMVVIWGLDGMAVKVHGKIRKGEYMISRRQSIASWLESI
jgi:hypothetical protein